jgi:hypothetical protein
VLCYSRQNRRAKFFSVMESKHITAMRRMAQFYVRSFLRNYNPSFANQCPKYDSRLRTAPFAQAGMWRTLIESGMSLDCSTSSAMAYRANAYAFAFASWTVVPYANAPGTSGISAIQRPSVSRSISNWNRKSRLFGSSRLLIRIGCAAIRYVARNESHDRNTGRIRYMFIGSQLNCVIPYERSPQHRCF